MNDVCSAQKQRLLRITSFIAAEYRFPMSKPGKRLPATVSIPFAGPAQTRGRPFWLEMPRFIWLATLTEDPMLAVTRALSNHNVYTKIIYEPFPEQLRCSRWFVPSPAIREARQPDRAWK